MDANQVRAVELKTAAENIIREDIQQEFSLAKEYATKAQELYPEMEGVSKFVATVEIYVAAASKVENEETDYYKVLGADPTDSEEEIKKRYKKLALLLHPDKNKSVGAVGAFQRISKAWELLSNKEERLAYDGRIAAIRRRVNESMPPDDSTRTSTPAPAPTHEPKAAQSKKRTHAPDADPMDIFWTACPHCEVYYKLDIMYFNRHLLCPECKKAFFPPKLGPPPKGYFRKPTLGVGSSTSKRNEFRGGSSSSTNVGSQVPSTNQAKHASVCGMHGQASGANFDRAYEQAGASFQPGFFPQNFQPSAFQHQNWFYDPQWFFQTPRHTQSPIFDFGGARTSFPENTTSVDDEVHQQPNAGTNAPPAMDESRNPENANRDFDLNMPAPDDDQ